MCPILWVFICSASVLDRHGWPHASFSLNSGKIARVNGIQYNHSCWSRTHYFWCVWMWDQRWLAVCCFSTWISTHDHPEESAPERGRSMGDLQDTCEGGRTPASQACRQLMHQCFRAKVKQVSSDQWLAKVFYSVLHLLQTHNCEIITEQAEQDVRMRYLIYQFSWQTRQSHLGL